MKRPLSSRIIAVVVLAAAALGAASAAHARPDIQVSIGLPGLPVFVQPPVHVRSVPVFVPPRPVYVPVAYERTGQPSYRSDFERERAWRHAEWQRREWEHRHHDRYRSYGRGRD
jgi:hypothetical protein